MNKKNILITSVIALIVSAGAFYGGMLYQQKQQPARIMMGRQGQNGQAGQMTQRFVNGNGERPVAGEIIAQDEKSVTVKMQDGSTKIVILSEATAINKAAEGTKADLTTGNRVVVIGKANSDGSITAQNIQLNPQMRVFGENTNTDK